MDTFVITFYIMDAEGNALEGANVNMNETDIATDVDGKAEFMDCPAGDYDYTVTMDGFNDVSDALTVDDNYDVSIKMSAVEAPVE